jgi:hypothetical protein
MLVRNQVFINPHLTKAEAMAAYEQRCQRRMHRKRLEHAPAEDVTADSDSFIQPTTIVNTGNVLAPTAAVFVPTSGLGRPVKLGGVISSETTKAANTDLGSVTMTFYIINPTSLVKHSALQQLETELIQFKIAIAIVSESWFNCNHIDQIVEIRGYVLLRKDRVKKKGGGVCLYVRDDINCSTLSLHPNSVSEFIEVLWSECRYGRAVYFIAACYHPPKARYSDSTLKAALTSDIECILKMPVSAGDTTVQVILTVWTPIF